MKRWFTLTSERYILLYYWRYCDQSVDIDHQWWAIRVVGSKKGLGGSVKAIGASIFPSVLLWGCYTPPCCPCPGRWGRRDERDLRRPPQIASQSVTFTKAGKRWETGDNRSLEKWCAALWRAPSQQHMLWFCDWARQQQPPPPPKPLPPPHPDAFGAGGAWANRKWTITSTSERLIFLYRRLFFSECQPGNYFAYIKSSEHRDCPSYPRTLFVFSLSVTHRLRHMQRFTQRPAFVGMRERKWESVCGGEINVNVSALMCSFASDFWTRTYLICGS